MKAARLGREAVLVAAALLALGFGATAAAENEGGATVEVDDAGFARDWAIDALSRTELSYYDVAGDGAAIYPDQGFQVFEELNASLDRRFGAYERLRGEVAMLLSDSEYRGARTFDVERASVLWEKGDALVTFRVRAGDSSDLLS